MASHSGLEPSISRRQAPPPQYHEQAADGYDEAEQGYAPIPSQYDAKHHQQSRQVPPPGRRDSPKSPTDAPPTWLERNRNLVLISLGILIVLVILLIWYQFTRQPTPVQPFAREHLRRQGEPPHKSISDEEAPAVGEEPSTAVDGTPESASVPAAETPASKSKPPAAKKPVAKPPQKRERVQGDTVHTADDKELNEFASMDISTPGGDNADAGAEEAESS